MGGSWDKTCMFSLQLLLKECITSESARKGLRSLHASHPFPVLHFQFLSRVAKIHRSKLCGKVSIRMPCSGYKGEHQTAALKAFPTAGHAQLMKKKRVPNQNQAFLKVIKTTALHCIFRRATLSY